MPIAAHKPDVVPDTQPNLPRVLPEEYTAPIEDDNEVPLQSLITYIQGAIWSCNWYSQIVTKDSEVRELDPGQKGVYQTYQCIESFELRVQSDLQSGFDSAFGVTTVTGSSLVYPCITPNTFDLFVASTGARRVGLFEVTNVERKNFNTDSVFQVDYKLRCYIDTTTQDFEDLESKTIRRYTFDRDRISAGLKPIVTSSEYNASQTLRRAYQELVRWYSDTFYNTAYGSLVLPGQQSVIYDYFLVNYFQKVVSTSDSLSIRHIRNLGNDGDEFLRQPTVWDAIYERSQRVLKHANKDMGVVESGYFISDPNLRGIRFSGIGYILYPSDIDLSIVLGGQAVPKFVGCKLMVDKKLRDISQNANYASITALGKTLPVCKPVLSHSSYLFSEGFYAGDVCESYFESLVQAFIRQENLNAGDVLVVYETFEDWGRLEQFYYGPILLTLMKACVGIY